jgi:aldehyde dehydrogenase (NAD+)
MDIAHRAGLPAGVLNLVLGSGSVVGEAICAHPDVDALSFTGSQAVGAQVAQHGVARLARVQLEMGGKNPLVIAADADLDVAAEVAVQGAFYSTGQRCTASSRLIVVDEAYDGFVEALVARMRRLTVGHALRPGTDIGPVVDGRQLAGNLEFVQRAGGSAGVEIIAGARVERDEPGFYMEPALVLGTGNDDEINREEVFGPVATVLRAADYEQALHLANDTRFGLCAGICTRSLRLAEHFKAHADAGMVMVNLPTAGVDYHVPFGGRKGSSYGPREQGTYAREFYTRTKTAYVGLR